MLIVNIELVLSNLTSERPATKLERQCLWNRLDEGMVPARILIGFLPRLQSKPNVVAIFLDQSDGYIM